MWRLRSLLGCAVACSLLLWRYTEAAANLLTLRVRLPDGSVKKVQGKSSETVQDILSRSEISRGADAGRVYTDASLTHQASVKTTLAELGLGSGDFLYISANHHDKKAVSRAKEEAVKRMKLATADGQCQGSHKFVPFPKLARPPPPKLKKSGMDLKDLQQLRDQTFRLKPQKDSVIKKLSVEGEAADGFVAHLKSTKCSRHRCALLYGTVDEATRVVKVQALWEPPQPGGDATVYDASSLEAGATQGDEEDAGMTEVARATKVASLLGLRPVGWCFSHDKRDHFIAAKDVVTASRLQLELMRDLGPDSGAFTATVTMPVNRTTLEIVTEAYSMSNLTVQMYSDGVFQQEQPEPVGNRIRTTEAVLDDKKEVTEVDTLGLICNVPIAQHKGFLRTRFPVANRGKRGTMRDVNRCLFAEDPFGHKKSFLKRMSDFQLLLFLSSHLGFSPDFESLCTAVREKDSKAPILPKYKLILETMCGGG